MLKQQKPVKSQEVQASAALRLLLGHVPAIKLLDIEEAGSGADHGIDVVAHLEVSGAPHVLVCEVRSAAQPRHVRSSLLHLRNYVTHATHDATPMLIAPYLSPGVQSMCRDQGVGYLDLEGNAHLSFDGIYIERQVASKPASERRELRSLFKPKSAQVLRVLLADPSRSRRVAELAVASGVSLGHVSNVRSALLAREWAKVSADGLSLTEPDALLDAWRAVYQAPAGERLKFYTTLHGSTFEKAARQVLRADGGKGLAVFASFSAAHWLAPYGRTGTQYFYADKAGLEKLRATLKLSAISEGENVDVTLVKDAGVFRDAGKVAPGVVCTSPVQTYLDLADAGERGREAAEHLRKLKLRWVA